MDRYRSGHNGPDSKTCDHFGSLSRKCPDFSRLPRHRAAENFPVFSPRFLPNFRAVSEIRNTQFNMQRYRSGHNENDSKPNGHFGSLFRKCLDFSRLSRYHMEAILRLFSPAFLSFFQGASEHTAFANQIRSGIEVVITGLIRNQFEGNLTWVRIPPAPPNASFHAVFTAWKLAIFCLLDRSQRTLQPLHHCIRRGQLGIVVQMGINIGRGREIAVAKPLLDLFHRDTVGEK